MPPREVSQTGRLILDQPFLTGFIRPSALSSIFSGVGHDLVCGDQEAAWYADRRDDGWAIGGWDRGLPQVELTTTNTRFVALDLARSVTAKLVTREFVPVRIPELLPPGVTAELTREQGITIRWDGGEATAAPRVSVSRVLELAQLVVTSDDDLRASFASPTGAPALRPVEEARAEYRRLDLPGDVHSSFAAWMDWHRTRAAGAEGRTR